VSILEASAEAQIADLGFKIRGRSKLLGSSRQALIHNDPLERIPSDQARVLGRAMSVSLDKAFFREPIELNLDMFGKHHHFLFQKAQSFFFRPT
jgi:hypothetical protein